MKTFTIENETNNITIHGSAREAEAVPNSERFSNEAALTKLAANCPASRLVEIWNSLPGETQVRKFKDRATAVSRIWKALQNLEQAAPVAVEEPAPVPEPLRFPSVPRRRPFPNQTPAKPPSRRQSVRSPRSPPLLRPLRNTAPTWRRRRLPRRRRQPGRKNRPSPRPLKMLVRPEREAKPAR